MVVARGSWLDPVPIGTWEKDVPMLLLHDLLRQIQPSIPLSSLPNAEVTGVQKDSRLVQPGNLFIARGGTKTDGTKFIEDAKSRGAIAAVTATATDSSLPQAIVYDPAAAASILTHAFFGHPTEKLRVLGITGTNGKTTTAYLLRHVLNKLKQRCGMIGTVEIDDGRSTRESTMTTPGAVEVAQLMAT